jgi:hypothetical protein
LRDLESYQNKGLGNGLSTRASARKQVCWREREICGYEATWRMLAYIYLIV